MSVRRSLAVTLGFAAVCAMATASARSLIEAAEDGAGAEAIGYLEAGADANERGADGATALIWAAYYDDVDLVRRLLAAGADVDARNEFGAYALSEAAIIGSTAVIEALLQAGADPNQANPEGETAIMAVARTGNVDAARLLVEAGADVNARESWGEQTALMWAAAQSHPGMVRYLASAGADVDAQGAIREWERKIITEPRPKDMNNGGFTPLLYAARYNCIECARELLAGGADPDLHDPDRVTPLNLALLNLNFDFAAFMIEAGADLDKWDIFGRSPVYNAVDVSTLPKAGNGAMVVIPSLDEHTALDVLSLLLEKGANPDIQLKRRPPYRNVPQDRGGDNMLSVGATPLLRAARAADWRAAEILVAHGANVNLGNNTGITPLMAAAGVDFGARATRGRDKTLDDMLKTLEVLVEAGADVNARMLSGGRGRTVAPNLSAASLARDLTTGYRGRQVPGPDAVPDRTTLHDAVGRGEVEIVEFLLAHGADVHAEDASGATALEALTRGGRGGRGGGPAGQPSEAQIRLTQLLETAMAPAGN